MTNTNALQKQECGAAEREKRTRSGSKVFLLSSSKMEEYSLPGQKVLKRLDKKLNSSARSGEAAEEPLTCGKNAVLAGGNSWRRQYVSHKKQSPHLGMHSFSQA